MDRLNVRHGAEPREALPNVTVFFTDLFVMPSS